MDIRSYFAILKGNLFVIVFTMLVTVAVVTLITFLTTPIFMATTTLRVATASSGVVGYSDYMYADRLMNTYVRLAMSRPVMNELAVRNSISILPEVRVETIANTELIKISVESSSAEIAQKAANSLAEILIDQGKELYSGGGKSTQEILSEQLQQAESELNVARKDYDAYAAQNPNDKARLEAMNDSIQLKEKTYTTLLDQYDQARLKETMRANLITVVEPAVLPLRAAKPNKLLNIALGILVGMVGGLGMAFVAEAMGPRLYTSRQIEHAADLKPIGKIPTLNKNRLLRFLNGRTDTQNNSFNEAFRRLQVQLLMQPVNSTTQAPLKTIMITSAEPGEGKSTILDNLAIAIAQSGKKVIVVDCDMHIPKQHKINGLNNTLGLSSILTQKLNVEKAIQKTRYPGFSMITSGPIIPNPTSVLGSPTMSALLKGLAQRYDMVLLDTPALLPLADAALLAPFVDGVLFVARRNYIREEAVREACRQLADIHAPMIGLVVNDAERTGSYYYDRHR